MNAPPFAARAALAAEIRASGDRRARRIVNALRTGAPQPAAVNRLLDLMDEVTA